MKNIKLTAIIIITALICLTGAPREASAAFVLGDKTVASAGRRAQKFTQSSTGLVAIQDVFEPQQITGLFTWTMYIHNTGTKALTDLNVLIHYENDNWAKAPFNLVDAQPLPPDFNVACTTTLAADTVCAVGITASAALGWVKVTASAGTATNMTIILYTSVI